MNLNWKEVQFICEALNPVLNGLKIDQVIIPERNWGEGFIKNEWALRIAGKGRSGTLVFGLRPYFPYFIWTQKQSPKSQSNATRSPFDLALSRFLPGSAILKIEPFEKERIFTLWFTQDKKTMGLVFSFLPKRSEILLIEKEGDKFAILSSSWLSKDSTKKKEYFKVPEQANPPHDIEVRSSIKENNFEKYFEEINRAIETEEFRIVLTEVSKSIESRIKNVEKKLKTLATTLDHIEKSQPWQKYGDVLKSHLGSIPKKIKDKTIELQDYSDGEKVSIPFNPKVSASVQVENFYENARKQKATQMETLLQRGESRNLLDELRSITLPHPLSFDWSKLEEIKNTFSKQKQTVDSKSIGDAPGKKFLSTDGMTIHVGRNKKENLELTFKFARGNDLWLHVKGKPSAHAIIILPSGKTASLETLLDAATLILHYSQGKDWGKTEVDYTYRKYVKRIKNSDEVSYTQNKTLMIELDSDRLNRILNPSLK